MKAKTTKRAAKTAQPQPRSPKRWTSDEPGVLSLPKIAELSSLITSFAPVARRVHELFLEADGTMSSDDCLRGLLEKVDTSVSCALSELCEVQADLIDTYSFGSTDARDWLREPWPTFA